MHVSGPVYTFNSRCIHSIALKFDLCFQFIHGPWLGQQRSQNELQLDDTEARVKGPSGCAQRYSMRNRKGFGVYSGDWH